MARVITKKWYDKKGASAKPVNKALGLVDVRLYNASDSQRSAGIICTAVVQLTGVSLRCGVMESKKNPDMLVLAVPGVNKSVNESTGEVKYFENVQLDLDVKAQVLRYIETQIVEE